MGATTQRSFGPIPRIFRAKVVRKAVYGHRRRNSHCSPLFYVTLTLLPENLHIRILVYSRKFFQQPAKRGHSPYPLKMNLQISLGKTNDLESQMSGFPMGKKWIGLTKDHKNVTS